MSAIAKKKLQVNLDADLAERVNLFLDAMGLTQTTVINMLYKKIDETGQLPFAVGLSAQTKDAIIVQENLANYIVDIKEHPENELTAPMNLDESMTFLNNLRGKK